MKVKVLSAATLSSAAGFSTNHHVHITHGLHSATVSQGLANEQTLILRDGRRNDVPVESRNARIFVNGDFGTGSATAKVAIDVGVSGSFLNLFSVSGAGFNSVIPVMAGDTFRFRYVTSTGSAAAAASALGTSIDAWIG